MGDHGERPVHGCGLDAYLDEPDLTEGQRRRLRLFQTVEGGTCARIERMCTEDACEVTDVAVLVVAPEVHALLFDGLAGEGGGERAKPAGARTGVILGDRRKLHAFLHKVLPPSEDASFDPYVDLMEPAPPRCVRVLIVDHESLTVMSYGSFVTLDMDAARMPEA